MNIFKPRSYKKSVKLLLWLFILIVSGLPIICQATTYTVSVMPDSNGSTSKNEGSSLRYKVTISPNPANNVKINFDYFTSDGSAKVGEDYTKKSGGSQFKKNKTSKRYTVKTTGDSRVEVDETINFHISNVRFVSGSSGNTIIVNNNVLTGTILNNDTASLSINNVSQSEGGGNAIFTVTSNKFIESPATISVNYYTQDNTAIANKGDYIVASSTISLSNGTIANISIEILDDDIVEASQIYYVYLDSSSVVGSGSIADNKGNGTIIDNDQPTLSIEDLSVPESSGIAGCIIKSDKIIESPAYARAYYNTVDNGTAQQGVDYTSLKATNWRYVTITGSQDSATFNVSIANDALVESDETFDVKLYKVSAGFTSANIGNNTGTVTIVNDDIPELRWAYDRWGDIEGTGTNKSVIYKVTSTLEVAQNTAINLKYYIDFNNNSPGWSYVDSNDFSGRTSGNISISDGSFVEVLVTFNSDNLVEMNENYMIYLKDPVIQGSASIPTFKPQWDYAYGHIDNDDFIGVNIEPGPKKAFEDEGPITFSVTLSNPVDWDVSVSYGFNIQGNDTATFAADYNNASTMPLFFPAGTTQKTITIPVLDDTISEPDEEFNISLQGVSPSSYSSINQTNGLGVILNDEFLISLSTGVNGDKGKLSTTFSPGATAPPDTGIKVFRNNEPTFSIASTDSCYDIHDVQIDGTSVGDISSYTFAPIRADHSINADFAIRQYAITSIAHGNNGTITPTSNVDCGSTNHIYSASAASGYFISWVKIDGILQASAAGQTSFTHRFNDIAGDHTFEAAFTQAITIIENSPFGNITPSGTGEPTAVHVEYGSDLEFTVATTDPEPDNLGHNGKKHHISAILIDGVPVTGITGARLFTTTYKFENITANHSIEPLFTSFIDVKVTGPGQLSEPLINNSGSTGLLQSSVEIEANADHVFTMKPDSGWYVHEVIADSVSVGNPGTFGFGNVIDRDRTLEVFFQQLTGFTIKPTSLFESIFTSTSLAVPADPVLVGYNGSHSFYVELDNEAHPVKAILIDNEAYTIPDISDGLITNNESRFTLHRKTNTDNNDYLEVHFYNVNTSHILEAQDYERIPISDIPLDARLRPEPASVMFVLDDSGSMDWEFITSEGNGLYSSYYYLFNYPLNSNNNHIYGTRAYNSASLQKNNRHDEWKSQWSSYNLMFYNPTVEYKPWPTWIKPEDPASPTSSLAAPPEIGDGQAHANIYRPRFHPWLSKDCETALKKAKGENADINNCNTTEANNNTFNMDGVFLEFTDESNAQIVDNLDAEFSKTGNWGSSSTSTAYKNKYYYTTSGSTIDKATWTLTPITSEEHDVYIWYQANSSRKVIPFTVKCDNCGINGTVVNIDQSKKGGSWLNIGTYDFNANETVTITLTDNLNKSSSSCADAVKIIPASGSNTIRIINAHYITWDDTDNDGLINFVDSDNDSQVDKSETINDTMWLVNLTNPIEYFKLLDNTKDISSDNLVRVDTDDVPATVLTYADVNDSQAWQIERQNWADWFSYYRKRTYAATAAVGHVINQMTNVQIGFNTINYDSSPSYGFRQSLLPVEVWGVGNKKYDLLKMLYEFQVSGKGTPLRRGLERVGQYYDDTDNNSGGIGTSPFNDTKEGNECKQAFTIVMTDGYWNGSTSLNVGDADHNRINNFEPSAPYRDNYLNKNITYSNTLADVAYYYFYKDLSNKLEDLVPDTVQHQHMVTYSVSFGVHGTLSPTDYDFNNNDFPIWPNPRSGDKQKIDDLWHAAVNGHGKFMSASRPDQLVQSLLDIMNDIGSRIGSGAAVSVNGDELYENVSGNIRIFQTTYNSSGWYGDLKAYSIDNMGIVQTDNPVWSAAGKVSDKILSEGHSSRIIASARYNNSEAKWEGTPFRWQDNNNNDIFSSLQQKQLFPYFTNTGNSEDVLNYLRGDNSNIGPFRKRAVQSNKKQYLGDFVDSLARFQDDFLYVGSNDGMLHAFWAIDSEDLDNDGHLDVNEDLDGDGHFDKINEDLNGNCLLDNEDQDGDGHLDVDEDLNNNNVLDVSEDIDGDGYLDTTNEDQDGDNHLDTVNEDIDDDGYLDINEDLNGNGLLDNNEDTDGDGNIDVFEDLDGDGLLGTVNEDLNNNGKFDLDEPDIDGDGYLDIIEDIDGDGKLDLVNEDTNYNGQLDLIDEDIDGDGKLDMVNEDLDGDGNLDTLNEDLDGDGKLDVNEDRDNDGYLDTTNEDIDGDGKLDVDEDLNNNGLLDNEDLDGDNHLDNGEDKYCDGWDPDTEDNDGDGAQDHTEDLDGDGFFDTADEDMDQSGTISTGGEERFAYIPGLVQKNLRELANPFYKHLFFVDNTPFTKKIDDTLTLLIGGVGKGGKGYYCLDVTDTATITSEQELADRVKWEYPPLASTLLSGNTFTFGSGTGTDGNDVIRDSASNFKGPDFKVNNFITITGTFDRGFDGGTNDETYEIINIAADGSFIEIASGSLIDAYGDGQNIIITEGISDSDMGYSFARPIIIKTNADNIGSGNMSGYVAMFGNGFDSENGNAVLYILNPLTGDVLKKIQTTQLVTSQEFKKAKVNGLSNMTVVDVNFDLKADYVYAGDLFGQMWKFDLTANDYNKWQVAYCDGGDSTNHCQVTQNMVPQPLYQGMSSQPITGSPAIMYNESGLGYMVIFGTGRYLSIDDVDSIETQSIYGIWDWAHDDMDDGYLGKRNDVDGALVTDPKIATLSHWEKTSRTPTLLRQVILWEGEIWEDMDNDNNLTTEEDANNNNKNDLLGYYRVPSNYEGNWDTEWLQVSFDINKDGNVDSHDTYRYPKGNLGWHFDLPGIIAPSNDGQDNDLDAVTDEAGERILGERVINDAIIRDGKAIIISFGLNGTRCNAGAYSFLMERNAHTGGEPISPAFDLNGDGKVNDDDVTSAAKAPSDKAFDGRLYNPAILRHSNEDDPDSDGEESLYMSSSAGRIEEQKVDDEDRGVYYWQQVE